MLHDDEPQFQLPDPGFLVLLIAVLVQRAGGSATITKDELYEISCGVLTEDALCIARGCTDYGGGHRRNAEHYEIYQHGIHTVISALTAASKTGLVDMQTKTLHTMGANALAQADAACGVSPGAMGSAESDGR